MQFLEWIVGQWPFAAGGAIAVMGVAAWFERIKKVQELELTVKRLQREERDRDNRIIQPTPEEVKEFGRSGASAIRKVVRRPDFLLGILAIIGPLVAFFYQQHLAGELTRKFDAQRLQIQSQIDAVDRELAKTATELEEANKQALTELSGQGSTHRLGAGPVYQELRQRHDVLSARFTELKQAKDRLRKRNQELRSPSTLGGTADSARTP